MLNPALYATLKSLVGRQFPAGLGRTTVDVVRENERMQRSYSQDPIRQRKDGQPWVKTKIERWGEGYTFDCPFCTDNRQRCMVSYRYGVIDQAVGFADYRLWHCKNETRCHEDPHNNRILYEMLQHAEAPMAKSEAVVSLEQQYGIDQSDKEINAEIPMPYHFSALTALPADHVMRRMIADRGMDIQRLETNWGCCYGGETGPVAHRMVVPIRQGGRLIGYQARYCGPHGEDNPEKRFNPRTGQIEKRKAVVCHACWSRFAYHPDFKGKTCPKCGEDKLKPIPKWQTAKGMRLDRILFNQDLAFSTNWDFAVLMEGPLDVIRLGTPWAPEIPGPGVALFKCDISADQASMLYQHCRQRLRPIFLVLDDDVYPKAVEDARKLCFEGAGAFQKDGRAMLIPVKLPDGSGPAKLPHDVLWECIKRTAVANDVPCSLNPNSSPF